MKNKLTKNWGLKLASFLFAAVLWVVVTNINDPIEPIRFSNIPVTIINGDLITERGQIYEVLDNTDMIDNVMIYAPRSVIDTLSESNVVAVADMEELSSLDTIAIKLSTNKYNNKIESIQGNIDMVKLNIEDLQIKSFPIQAGIVGEVGDGYMLGDVTTEQNLIRVSGPESVVSQIAKAQAEVDVSGFTRNINTDADVRLYNDHDNVIPTDNLERSITKVRVNIEILEKKSVPITYTVSGTPADGYQMTGESTSTRNNVVIAGRSQTVQSMNAIEIPEGVIDITDATADVSTLVDIKDYLPDGVIIAEDDFTGMVEITVSIGQVVRRTFSRRVEDISITGVPTGFQAVITDPEENCSVSLMGLAGDFQSINISELQVSVNVAEWLRNQGTGQPVSGYYNIPISVNLPADSEITWEEQDVLVHITETE